MGSGNAAAAACAIAIVGRREEVCGGGSGSCGEAGEAERLALP